MAVAFSRWERRDTADREEFGMAALAYCRAAKAAGTTARFYWTGADSIAILAESDAAGVFDQVPSPDMAKALFTLGDLARCPAQERWIDPKTGMASYQAAGR